MKIYFFGLLTVFSYSVRKWMFVLSTKACKSTLVVTQDNIMNPENDHDIFP